MSSIPNKTKKKNNKTENSNNSDTLQNIAQPVTKPPSLSSPASQPSSQELETADPGEWYPHPPHNYRFVNTIPKYLIDQKEGDKEDGQRKKARSHHKVKPDTKEFYDSKNSVEQPPDGDEVKEEDEACLTCISQGGTCHGTSVMDGKCESCRGLGPEPGKFRQQRVCRWKQPTQGVYTYIRHQEVNGGTLIKRNTAAWRKTHNNREDPDEDAESEPDFQYVTIWHFPYGSYPHALLRWLAALVVDNGLHTDDLNLNALISITRARYVYASRNPKTFINTPTQQSVLQALNEIYHRLKTMEQNGMVIVLEDILEMIPEDHPAHLSSCDDLESSP